MTHQQFKDLWASIFPDAPPIAYFFKHDYEDRWFRIHSLPESKRYAEEEKEWDILLQRQNTLITDLLGDNTMVWLVTGEYSFDENNGTPQITEDPWYAGYDYAFTQFDTIDLAQLDPDQYKGTKYKPAFAATTWQRNGHDKLLKSIANDEMRAFFVLFDKQLLIAPYDGGMDIVLKDSAARDHYKNKYREWLSGRDDGM